ncbi:MAG: ATP-binding cassette domain-containing protein, partial [Actinomycetota bacterium]
MLLQVRELTVRFGDDIVDDDVSFDLDSGQRLGIIGESGAGKTLTSLAVIGLLPDTASVQGSIVFDGVELLEKTDAEMTSLRGSWNTACTCRRKLFMSARGRVSP